MMKKDYKKLILAVLIILAGLIAYANSLNGKFVLDDENLIKANAFIKSPSDIIHYFSTNILAGAGKMSGFYRPLQMASYNLNYAIAKFNVIGYHLTNILLHILVALCIYWLIYILFNNSILSFITSILFVAHPIHTEAVSYISGRADPLAAFFMLLCFIIYIQQVNQDRINIPGYTLLLLTYSCALLSKETSVILPLILLFYHFVFKRKIKVIEFLSMVGILIMYVAIRLTYLKYMLPTKALGQDTLFDRIPGLFAAISSYIKLLFLPFSLHMEYGTKIFTSADPGVVMGIIITFVILAYAYMNRSDKIILFATGWFFLTLLPVSNLYRINAYMAEHFLYLPSMGFFLILAYLLTVIYGNRRYKALGITLTACCLLFYSGLTIRQNRYWRDPLVFYEKTLNFAPYSAKAYNNRGNLYDDKGDSDRAISDLNEAIKTDPNYALAYCNRGAIYINKGNYDQSISDCTKAIELDPTLAEAYNNRGNAYNNKGDYDQAILDCNKAIELKPNYAKAYNNRASAYINKKNYDQAILDCTKAIEIDPDLVMAYNNRGIAYIKKDDYDQAILDCSKAIELYPDFAIAYANRIIAYYYKNEFDKAWDDVRKAESLGYKVNPKLIELLKKSAGKQK